VRGKLDASVVAKASTVAQAVVDWSAEEKTQTLQGKQEFWGEETGKFMVALAKA
jgi:hypothetical protein